MAVIRVSVVGGWRIQTLHGELTLPLALGYVGGATRVFPLVVINSNCPDHFGS